MSPRNSQLTESLNNRRPREADVEWMYYIRPRGTDGFHFVQRQNTGKQMFVSGPLRTFKPGTLVPVASNTGYPGRTIVDTNAPPGQRGASPIPANQPPIIECTQPATPLDIFGGGLLLWYDLYEQRASPTTSLIDYSGNGKNDGPKSITTGNDGKTVWVVSGSGSSPLVDNPNVPSSSNLPFAAFMVMGFTASSNWYPVYGSGSAFVRWNASGATLKWTSASGPTSTLTYPSGLDLMGVGVHRDAIIPATPIVFQKEATTETLVSGTAESPFTVAGFFNPDFTSLTVHFRMLVVTDNCNAEQHSQMATYMDFMKSACWE